MICRLLRFRASARAVMRGMMQAPLWERGLGICLLRCVCLPDWQVRKMTHAVGHPTLRLVSAPAGSHSGARPRGPRRPRRGHPASPRAKAQGTPSHPGAQPRMLPQPRKAPRCPPQPQRAGSTATEDVPEATALGV